MAIEPERLRRRGGVALLGVAVALGLTACSSSLQESASDIADDYVASLQTGDRAAFRDVVGDENAGFFDAEVACLDWASVSYSLTPDPEVGSFFTARFVDEQGGQLERTVQNGGTVWKVETPGIC